MVRATLRLRLAVWLDFFDLVREEVRDDLEDLDFEPFEDFPPRLVDELPLPEFFEEFFFDDFEPLPDLEDLEDADFFEDADCDVFDFDFLANPCSGHTIPNERTAHTTRYNILRKFIFDEEMLIMRHSGHRQQNY